MDLSKRNVDSVLVVDIFGQFPDSMDEVRTLREAIRSLLGGHNGRVVFHLHDADYLRSAHLGAVIGGVREAGIDVEAVRLVSASHEVRSILNVIGPVVRTFETEDEAVTEKPRDRSKASGWVLWVAGAVVVVASLVVIFLVA